MKVDYINSLKKKYEADYAGIKKEIFIYCDLNRGKISLFPAFVNLVEDKLSISRRDLVVLVSDVLDELCSKKIKNENILEITQNSSSEGSGYAFYKILPHENLVKHNAFIEKKMKMLN